MSWYVLYTKSRAEIKAAEFFEEMDVEVYCPVVTEVRQWSDRKKKVTTPLFKSYIFVNLGEKERNRAFQNPYVISYLFWLKKPAIVKDDEIRVIKEWLNNDQVDNIEVGKYFPGDEITINRGALKDKKAIIQEVGKKRMRLVLPHLGFTVNVEIKDVV